MRNRRLTTTQAAKFLGVSQAFLERDRWASTRTGHAPRIPFVRVGKRGVSYERAVLEAFGRHRTRRRADRDRLLQVVFRRRCLTAVDSVCLCLKVFEGTARKRT